MRRKLVGRSKLWMTTGEMGEVVPIGLWEVLPNETVSHRTNLLIRVTPMAAPVMHSIFATVVHFFCPTRILWPKESCGTPGNNWEEFITGGEDGQNAATPPTRNLTGAANDLLDSLGLPTHAAGVPVNDLPIRAYNRIFNYWLRDQDLVPARDLTDITVARAAWQRDYFSTARPFLQRGPGVTIPLGSEAPVSSRADAGNALGILNKLGNVVNMSSGGADLAMGNSVVSHEMFADLSAATGIDIADLRKAAAIQRFQENRARWGARYVEYAKRSFGARPQDSRLQEPELLGGGRAPIQVSEIIQTGPYSTSQPNDPVGMGDLWGHGISAMRNNGYRYTCPEHGYVVSLLMVRPRAVYMQGIDRHWLKKVKEDYFQPELKAIGQQGVYNNEIYAQTGEEGMNDFGYQDRYSEYRFARNRVCREFRSELKHWHMAREFESAPVLNRSFVDCVPTKRIYNEQTKHPLWMMAQHQMRVLSPVGPNTAPRLL